MDAPSPYLVGPYAPTPEEVALDCTPIVGAVPTDLRGAYVRNGPNPQFAPRGRYHWFDGDGMLHAAWFEGGRARYANRYVRTAAFEREAAAGRALWSGIMEPLRDNPRDMPYKDAANTDVCFHDGALIATYYVGGTPMRVHPRTLAPLGGGVAGAPARFSAHAKVDPATGELFCFDFGPRPPFLRYAVVGPGGRDPHTVPLEVGGPRLPHDMCFTKKHALLMDLPIHFDLEQMEKGRWRTTFRRDVPARFAILPRRGTAVRWFEAEPCYVYHAANAWDDGDAVVMVGCRVDDPLPAPDPADGPHAIAMANLRVRARLWRWRFDLATGRTEERCLDDRNTEFPAIAGGFRGQRTRFAYNVTLATTRTLGFDGLVKYDTDTGHAEHLPLGPGRFGSEMAFAPREGATAEDDGYLVTFVRDEAEGRSELWILDARQLTAGPIARLHVPARVPLGFHATWVTGRDLDAVA